MARQWSVLLLLLGVSLAFAASEVHEASVKEVRRLDDTTRPPDSATEDSGTKDSATSILLNLWDNIALLLHSPERQWLHALIAFIFGVPLTFASVSMFDLIIIAAHFLLACVLTQSEASSFFHVDHTDPLALFMGIQVAVLCTWATYKGIAGARVIYTALLGVAIAMVVQTPLVSLGFDQLEGRRWNIVAYYSFFVWIALGMYMKSLNNPIVAVCCSVLGAALITSAGAWGITFCVLQNAKQQVATTGHTDLHPVGGDWVDFFFMLFTGGSKDLGAFAGFSDIYNVDLIADRTMWFLLASGGILFQLKRMKPQAGLAKAHEGLSQKLLVAEL